MALPVLAAVFPDICVKKCGDFCMTTPGLKSGGHVPLTLLWNCFTVQMSRDN